MHKWTALLIGAVSTFVIAGCTTSQSNNPDILNIPTEIPQEVSRALERLGNVQKMAPYVDQQLKRMEELHPDQSINCSSAYPEKCIPPPPPHLDCKDISQRNFFVLPPDPHNFDPDHDGIGCEE